MDKFEQQFKELTDKLSESPEKFEQYENELEIFADILANQKTASSRIWHKIALANAKLSNRRTEAWQQKVRTEAKEPVIFKSCATHMSHVRKALEHYYHSIFSEQEITDLANCLIEGKALNQRQHDMAILIIHNTPNSSIRAIYPFSEK